MMLDKRNRTAEEDEAKKSYLVILEQEIVEGSRELERPALGLALSGLAAGMEVGFGPLLMAVTVTVAGGLSEPVLHFVLAGMYSVGFIFVILGRSELFTEHTALAVLPVLGGRASVGQLARLWGLVYGSNQVGSTIFAAIAVVVGPAMGIASEEAFAAIANRLVSYPWWVVLLSGGLAGWLMGLLSWLVAACRDTISQIVLVALVTGAIGLCGFHHSVAGAVEILMGVFSGSVSATVFLRILLLATVGNAIGGLLFVALLKYAHATQTAPEES